MFDIRVEDTDAQSYVGCSPTEVLITAEKEKKAKYAEACLERRALFTLVCVSVDSLLGYEASSFIKRLAYRLSSKLNLSYSTIVCWLRTHLTFSILLATNLCLRGSRTKWRTIDLNVE